MLSPGETLFSQFQVIKALGKGAFAQVFQGTSLTSSLKVAIKTESPALTLHSEVDILRELTNIAGVPSVLYYKETEDRAYLVMKQLGKDLETVRRERREIGSVGNVLKIAWQLLRIVEEIHGRGVLHMDIKPDNVLLDSNGKLHLIDFNLAQRLSPSKRSKDLYCGSPLFCSARRLERQLASRKDDIESWFYTVVFLVSLSLPWDMFKSKEGDWCSGILQMKRTVSSATICGKLPPEFSEIHTLITHMQPFQSPPYSSIFSLLQTAAASLNVNIATPVLMRRARSVPHLPLPIVSSTMPSNDSETPKGIKLEFTPVLTSLVRTSIQNYHARRRRASANE